MKAAYRELLTAPEVLSAPGAQHVSRRLGILPPGVFGGREGEEGDELLEGWRRSEPLFKHEYLW